MGLQKRIWVHFLTMLAAMILGLGCGDGNSQDTDGGGDGQDLFQDLGGGEGGEEATADTSTPAEFRLTPNAGTQGEALNLTLLCSNAELDGEASLSFGEGITVLGKELDSSHVLFVRISIDFNAALGPREVLATTSAGSTPVKGGFTVLTNPLLSGIVQFTLQKDNLGGDEQIKAYAIFAEPHPDLERWFTGFAEAPPEGQVTFQCIFQGEDCYTPDAIWPDIQSAGDWVTISRGEDALTMERYYFDPKDHPDDFVYFPVQPLDPKVFSFNTEYSLSAEGGLDVPAFESTFMTPLDFRLMDHNLRENTLDVVYEKDLAFNWEIDPIPEGFQSRVVIRIIRVGFMIGVMEWLTFTVPDVGYALLPAAELEKLGLGMIQTTITRELLQRVEFPDIAPVKVISNVEYRGYGEVFPAGTKLVYLEPSSGRQGETLDISMLGINTQFEQGKTWANFDAGTRVNSVTVTGPTTATANISIDSQTPRGFRNVTVHTDTLQGPEHLVLEQRFGVAEKTPECTLPEEAAQEISGLILPGEVACGTIDPGSDIDTFQFAGVAGDVAIFAVKEGLFGSKLGSVLSLYDDSQPRQLLAQYEWDGGVIASELPATGNYFVTVESMVVDVEGGDDFFYFLEFSSYTPQPVPAAPANDSCELMQEGFALADGVLYTGNTLDFTNSIFPEQENPDFEGCLDSAEMAGNDAVYPVLLDAGETLIVWQMHPETDSSSYVLAECGKVTSCVLGADHNPWKLPEAYTIRNETDSPATYYLMVDSYWASFMSYDKGGKFYLLIDRY